MRTSYAPWRSLLVLAAAAAFAACSQSFWDRSPRVGGRTAQPGPAAPRASTLPPPQVRALPYGTEAPRRATPAPGVSTSPTAEDQQVLALVNQIRRSRGLRALVWNDRLYAAAWAHSDEQNTNGYMGHDSPDPGRRTLLQRMGLVGYEGMMYGEVVAWGYRDARSVVEGWMNSGEHRRILVDPELTEAAFSRIGSYWTGNFGAPRAAPPPVLPAPVSRPPEPMPAPRTFAPTPRYTAPAPRPAPAPSALPPARVTPPVSTWRPQEPAPVPPVPAPRPLPSTARGG